MAELSDRFRNRRFGWAFLLLACLVTAAAWWGESVGLSVVQRAVMLAVGGLIPLTIQVVTGYGLDSGWTARFSRIETPRHYWGSLAAAVAVAVAFAWGAYSMVYASA